MSRKARRAGELVRRFSANRRRPIRSSLAGPFLNDPEGRIAVFRKWSAATFSFLRNRFPEELAELKMGFSTVPMTSNDFPGLEKYDFYEIDRVSHSIILYRGSIQQFKRLHVDDEDHRRFFVEHVVYRAICDYLEVSPWELMPGYFEHY